MKLVERIISEISPGWAAKRSLARIRAAAFAAADPRSPFLSRPWNAPTATANQAIVPSLQTLINRSRDALRRHPGAVAAVAAKTANVVGVGIDIEPNSGEDDLDDILSDGWAAWADNSTTEGRTLWEAQAMGHNEWITAGGFLWRWVMDPSRIEQGLLPDCLLELDVEWLSDLPIQPVSPGNTFVAGVEVDSFNRPQRFHLRNPDLNGTSLMTFGGVPDLKGEVVPASEIIHGYRRTRPGQVRGDPELAPALLQLWNGIELIDAELKAAIVGAAPTVLVKTRSGGSEVSQLAADAARAAGTDAAAQIASARASGQEVPALTASLPIGGVAGLFPDEDVEVVENKRPSQGVHPFLKGIHGLAAACLKIGRRWIDRDVSDANYSSQRADQQDTQRLLEPEQEHFGRHAAVGIYRRIAPLIAAAAGRPMPAGRTNARRRAQLLRCEIVSTGWPYVNPLEDVQAACMKMVAGLSVPSIEIGKTGGSIRRLWRQAQKDDALRKKMGLTFDWSGTNAPAPASTKTDQPQPTTAPQQPQGTIA